MTSGIYLKAKILIAGPGKGTEIPREPTHTPELEASICRFRGPFAFATVNREARHP